MSTSISPLRRVAVTLAMTGVAAFGAVTVAPAAFAADSVAVQSSVTDPAAVADPAAAPAADPTAPAVVYDQNGKPVKAPKVCTAKDLADVAKKVADATAKVAPKLQLAAKSHDAATLLRAEETSMTPFRARLTEVVADGLESLGDRLEAQAQAVIDAAGQKDCIVLPTGGRF